MGLLVALKVARRVERLPASLHLAHKRPLARVHLADVYRLLRRVLERPAAAERARDVAGGVRRGYFGHHVVHDLAPARRWGGGEVSSTGHEVGEISPLPVLLSAALLSVAVDE